jgi:hypothetical protein
VALVAFVVLTGCEPKMTITAQATGPGTTVCGLVMHVKGTVTPPANATPKVVLQESQQGKWVDAKGAPSADAWLDGVNTVRTANVAKSGAYTITMYVYWFGTKHLRVRSNESKGLSPSFYVTTTSYEGDCS